MIYYCCTFVYIGLLQVGAATNWKSGNLCGDELELFAKSTEHPSAHAMYVPAAGSAAYTPKVVLSVGCGRDREGEIETTAGEPKQPRCATLTAIALSTCFWPDTSSPVKLVSTQRAGGMYPPSPRRLFEEHIILRIRSIFVASCQPKDHTCTTGSDNSFWQCGSSTPPLESMKSALLCAGRPISATEFPERGLPRASAVCDRRRPQPVHSAAAVAVAQRVAMPL